MEKQIVMVPIASLRPHPRNLEFFDDIDGEPFERLKESVSHMGILTPIRIAADMTIISGHQRVRACQALGIKEVPAVWLKDLEDSDEIEMQLIASNFGRAKNDALKQSHMLAEYVRLMGITNGGVRRANEKQPSSLSAIAEEFGVDVTTIKNLLRLDRLPDEVKETVQQGVISPTTAIKCIAKLPMEEQLKLVRSLDATQTYTKMAIQKKLAELEGHDEAAVKELASAKQEIADLQAQVKAKEERVLAPAPAPDSAEIEALHREVERLSQQNREYFTQLRTAKETADAIKQETRRLADVEYQETIRCMQAKLDEKTEELTKAQSAAPAQPAPQSTPAERTVPKLFPNAPMLSELQSHTLEFQAFMRRFLERRIPFTFELERVPEDARDLNRKVVDNVLTQLGEIQQMHYALEL